LEWQTASPPIIENFEEEPVLWAGPYDYGIDTETIDGNEDVEDMLAAISAEGS
jgi:cytochrome c oxidase subunit 1